MNFFIRGLTLSLFAFMIWVIYQINTGAGVGSALFIFVKSIPFGDKIGHFVLFGLLTLTVNFSLKLKTIRINQTQIYLGTVIVILIALLEEFSQFFMPRRTVDIMDLMAGGLGIALFTYISIQIERYIKNRELRKPSSIQD